MAVAILGCGFLVWKLSEGPLSLGILSPVIETTLNAAIEDFRIEIDDAVLRWSESDRSLHIRVLGVDFIDAQDTLIGNVPEIEVDLDVASLARGQFSPSRIELFGPSAAVVRRLDGGFQLGFSDDLVSREPSTSQSGDVEPETNPGEILGMLVEQLRNEEGAASKLKTFTIRDAKLEFFDRQSGTLWVAPNALLSIDRAVDGVAWLMAGTFRVGAEEVEVVLNGALSEKVGSLWSEIEFSDVHPSSFAAKSTFFSDWAGFDFPVNGKAAFQLGADGKVETAELELAAGEGSIKLNVLGDEALAVGYGAFSATYSGSEHRFDIKRLHYAAGENRATFSGTTHAVFDTSERLRLTSARFDLVGQDISLFFPNEMTNPAAIDTFALKGFADIDNTWLSIQEASIDAGPTRVTFEGDIIASDTSPMIVLNAKLTNLPIEKLDTYWPKTLGLGARNWVMERIKGGAITKGDLKINAAAGDFAQKPMPDKALQFAFTAEGGSVKYKRGLPWMEDASGEMLLTGRSFDLTLHQGIIRDNLEQPVTVAKGSTVSIADLHIKGSPVIVNTNLSGRAEDILALVNHEPLSYLSKFGLDPSFIHGRGNTDMWFSIPMVTIVQPGTIQFSAKGRIEGLNLTGLPNNLQIDDGTLDLEVDLAGLTGTGGILVEGVPVNVQWKEDFTKAGDKSSTFNFSAVIDDVARDEWGIDMLGYFSGPIPIDVVAVGRGTNIRDISVKALLDDAEIEIASFGYQKPSGEKAAVTLNASIEANGAFTLEALDLSGENIGVQGSMTLAGDGRLETANFERVFIDDVVDVAFLASRGTKGELDLEIKGRYLNAAPFLEDVMRDFARGGSTSTAEENEVLTSLGWTLRGDVEDLYLRGGVAMENVKLEIENDGSKFRMISVTGDVGARGKVFAALTSGSEHKRQLLVTATDAGRLVQGITGVDQVKGGDLSLRMEFDDSPVDVITAEGPLTLAQYLNDYAHARQEGDSGAEVRAALGESASRYRNIKTKSAINGYLKMDDFRLTDVPILARLLTVGSLRGLSDTLNGDGIHFETLEAPFWVDKSGVIGISDATASGPALGLTLYGTFDQGTDETDMQGTIVPSYTLNSALGNLPIFGPILVSREGEGVFAFTYGISGPTSGPTVFVNPLAGLAPGVLRRVFQPRDQLEARRVPVDRLENTQMPLNPADGAPGDGLSDLPEELVDGPAGDGG
jgi:hypothetical protein